MKYKQIIKHLNFKFPSSKSEKWDFVGSTFGDAAKDIKNVIVALDLTSEVLSKAIKNDIDLIVIHHPFIFNDSIEEELKLNPYKVKIYNRIINTGVCVFASHTNFDTKAMPTIIAKKLGYEPKKLRGTKYGFVFTPNKTIALLKKELKTKFKLKSVRSTNDEISSGKVAFFPGSSSYEEFIAAKKQGVNTIVTSDIKWSEQIFLEEEKMSIIDIPHCVENEFVDYMTEVLKTKFPDLNFITIPQEEIIKYG